MNAPVRNLATDVEARRDYVLQALRVTSRCLKMIDEEVILIGVLLKKGFISPTTAVELTEEVAPGCINVVAESITVEGVAE